MHRTQLIIQLANLRKTFEKKCFSTVKRHRWTPQELNLLLKKYRSWAKEYGTGAPFKLKDFVLSMREHFSFFDELDERHFYDRVKRTLYRTLIKTGTAWLHSNKTRLEKVKEQPELTQIINQLEEKGVAIATDGSVLLIFPVQYYTHQPDDGYFVPTIGHAITHLKKLAVGLGPEHQNVKEEAQQVIPLLQRFIQVWKTHPERDQLFDPNIKNKIDTEDYAITQMPDNPALFEVKKVDGTRYYCDVEKHTCTCPAGAKGLTCKHLNTILFQ